MPKHTQHDNELATFTNQLLAGKEPVMSTDELDLAEIVRQLHRTITPSDPVPATFKSQLAQRLEVEWDLQYPRKVHWWAAPRVQQTAMLIAASVALVFAATLALSTVDQDNGGALEGAANGPLASVAIIGLIAAGLLGLVFFLRRDR